MAALHGILLCSKSVVSQRGGPAPGSGYTKQTLYNTFNGPSVFFLFCKGNVIRVHVYPTLDTQSAN
jgi:hypothetical protein